VDFDRTTSRGIIRTPGVAAVLACLALLAAALPALASDEPIRLSNPRVRPGSPTAHDPITLQITYRHVKGFAPDRVWVELGDLSRELNPDGADWERGVEFAVVLELPAGSYRPTFAAAVGADIARTKGRTMTVRPVVDPPEAPPVEEAPPTDGPPADGSPADGSPADGPPTPEPPPQQPPPQRPAPQQPPGQAPPGPSTPGSVGQSPSQGGQAHTPPGAGGESGSDDGADDSNGTPAAGAGSGSPGGSGASGGGNGPADPGSDGTPADALAEDGDSGNGWSEMRPWTIVATEALNAAGSTNAAIPASGDIRSAMGDGAGASLETRPWRMGGTAGAWGDLLAAFGGASLPPHARLLSVTMTVTGAVVMTLAFGFFAKRRRDGDPIAPDEVLEARAASAGAFTASSLVATHETIDTGGGPSWPVAAPDDPEASMPRWRRPSLQQARKADPAMMERVHVAMTFAGTPAGSPVPAVTGGMAPLEGLERRRIKYRLVRLLDGPDELRAGEIGYLDEGDEVQLVVQSGAYWLVHCPNGQQGWIHRMTLGDVIATAHVERAGEHSDEVDSDVLAAFLASRAAN
jgi:hypothetical protein